MTVSANRKAMLAKIHIAKKDLALADDSYRALVCRVTGRESAKDCTDRALNDVLAALKDLGWKPKRAPKRAGAKRLYRENEATKIRALWLSLYHLGEIENPSEAALASYTARMTKDPAHPEGIEALNWLDAATADKVINALRGWCTRVGFRHPDAAYMKTVNKWRAGAGLNAVPIGVVAKYRLLNAQWCCLRAIGAFNHPEHADLGRFLNAHFGAAAPHFLDADRADRAIERLGKWVRSAKGNSE